MALTEEGLVNVPGVASRWVRLASGAKAHYVTAGHTGPAVILLHGGLPGSSGIAGWRFMLPYLAGFGLADTRNEYWPHYGMFSWADFVHEFSTALGLDRFHLAGNSQGAGVTAQYVVEHPERVINYILIASFSIHAPLGLDKDGKARERHPGLPIPKWDGKNETMRNMMESIIYRKEAISDDLITMRTNMANAQDGPFKAAVKFTNETWSTPSYAQRIMARTHSEDPRRGIATKIVPGPGDRGRVPHTGERIPDSKERRPHTEERKPGSGVRSPETGHQGQTDRPELFNKVFVEFFQNGQLTPELDKEASISDQKAVKASW